MCGMKNSRNHLLGKSECRHNSGVVWSSPCNDGVNLAGNCPCGWLNLGPYHLDVVPLQGLLSWHQCKGAEWLITAVRVQNAVLPLLWCNSGSPSVME